jgi:hypothetical protein
MRQTSIISIVAAWVGLAVCQISGAATDISGLPDPTRPAAAGESEAVANRGLSAIRITPRQRFAVIDGRTVSVGDSVPGGVVQDIRQDEVTIKSGERVTRMRLVPSLKRATP